MSIEYLNVETRLFAPPTKISGYSPGSQFEEVEWFIERKSSFLWQTVWKKKLQLRIFLLKSRKITSFSGSGKYTKKVLFIPAICCWNNWAQWHHWEWVMPSLICSGSLEVQVLVPNCYFNRGAFQQISPPSFCFSCLWEILRSRTEANATCCRLLPTQSNFQHRWPFSWFNVIRW